MENVVSDTCEDCGYKVWYDANNPTIEYCEDKDLAIEHECDPDDEDDDDDYEDEPDVEVPSDSDNK